MHRVKRCIFCRMKDSNFSLSGSSKSLTMLSSRAKSRDLGTDFTANPDEMRRFLDSLTLARNDILGRTAP